MIVSHRARLFIATPTKTGTHSLEAVATRPVNGDALALAEASPGDRRRRMHRMAPDPAWAGYSGHLLVRNPWSRWVSVYEYLRAPKFYAQWGAKRVQGSSWGGDPAVARTLPPPMTFEDFLRFLQQSRAEHYTKTALRQRGSPANTSAYRSPWVWLDSLAVSRQLLDANLNGVGPASLIRMEHLEDDLRRVLAGHDGLDLHVDQLNKTTDPTHPHWTDYWQSPKARLLAASLGIDREAYDLGYDDWRPA